jgi:hypothetical protein
MVQILSGRRREKRRGAFSEGAPFCLIIGGGGGARGGGGAGGGGGGGRGGGAGPPAPIKKACISRPPLTDHKNVSSSDTSLAPQNTIAPASLDSSSPDPKSPSLVPGFLRFPLALRLSPALPPAGEPRLTLSFSYIIYTLQPLPMVAFTSASSTTCPYPSLKTSTRHSCCALPPPKYGEAFSPLL